MKNASQQTCLSAFIPPFFPMALFSLRRRQMKFLLAFGLFVSSISMANAGAGTSALTLWFPELESVFGRTFKAARVSLTSRPDPFLPNKHLGVRPYSTERFLDPKNDVAFKKLFTPEGHKPLLMSFLNSLLRLEENRVIKQVELLPTEQMPPMKSAKPPLLNVICTDQSEAQYIVEIQNEQYGNFIKRPQFFQHRAANSYVNQFGSGLVYKVLNPVVLLVISNSTLFPKKSDYSSYHRTVDIKTQESDLDDLSYAVIELPKFKKTEEELKTPEDKWLYFFKQAPKLKTIPKNSPREIKKAYTTLEEINWTQKEKEAYDKAKIELENEIDSYKYHLHGGV